jgi:hypothetical protein
MSTLFPTTIDYEIHGTGKRINGIYVPGTTTTSQFIGSVQPMSGKEVMSLPVGRQDTGKVKIYSNTQLPVSTQGDTDIEPGAIVSWQGQNWEVIQELGFQNGIIPHYKYIGELRE